MDIEVDGERVYGRGTADNKSQHWINIIALKHTLETRGALGFNAKFIVETGEENGSLRLGDVIAQISTTLRQMFLLRLMGLVLTRFSHDMSGVPRCNQL